MEKGKAIYQAKCSQCHGDLGDGKGVAADVFNPKPRDFTSGSFKIRTTESGELPTHQDLENIIRRGVPYTGMPAWPKFTATELSALASYVETLNADFADTAHRAKSKPVPKPEPYSQTSVDKGRKVFEENKCADCHGKLGRGDGESAPTLKDDAGHFIRPADLTKPWTFRGGSSPEDIYRTFTTGLNGTPMPSFANSIGETDRWNLVNYLISLAPGSNPPYATVVLASPAAGRVDLSLGDSLFTQAKPALFPVIGQVVENPRCFAPAANAVEVRAVFDSVNVALRVSWHDMSAQKTGSNSPVADSSRHDSLYSDAVAVQIPLKDAGEGVKPYFLFGDAKNPVELWFADLAQPKAALMEGKGNVSGTPLAGTLESKAQYADGEWVVYFLRPRKAEKRLALEGEQFIPIAFSVWDGFNKESGSERGVTAWMNLYLLPPKRQSPLVPASEKAGAVLAVELAAILYLRRRYRKSLPD